MDSLQTFVHIVPYLTDPLALVGFALLLFFIAFRHVIRTIPRVPSKVAGIALLRLINLGFVLAFLTVVLSFGLRFFEVYAPSKTPITDRERKVIFDVVFGHEPVDFELFTNDPTFRWYGEPKAVTVSKTIFSPADRFSFTFLVFFDPDLSRKTSKDHIFNSLILAQSLSKFLVKPIEVVLLSVRTNPESAKNVADFERHWLLSKPIERAVLLDETNFGRFADQIEVGKLFKLARHAVIGNLILFNSSGDLMAWLPGTSHVVETGKFILTYVVDREPELIDRTAIAARSVSPINGSENSLVRENAVPALAPTSLYRVAESLAGDLHSDNGGELSTQISATRLARYTLLKQNNVSIDCL